MKKVLIAEHSAEERRTLEALLAERCAVTSCGDGATAAALLRDFSPDIFVLDLALEQLDGLALLEQLQMREPRPKALFRSAWQAFPPCFRKHHCILKPPSAPRSGA